jgi:hypothetical protein
MLRKVSSIVSGHWAIRTQAQRSWLNAVDTDRPPLLIAFIICAAFGLLSVAFGPDNNWDLRFYHLYAPWAYIHNRYLYDIAPAQYQGFFNPTSDLLFYALVSSPLNATPRLFSFIMGAVHGINAVIVLAIAYYVLRPLAPGERLALRGIALLIGTSGAAFISLLGVTTNDLTNSIFVSGALLGLLRLGSSNGLPEEWHRFAWPGLLAGIGIGLKYTAIIFMPGLGLIALITAIQRRSMVGIIAFGGGMALGFTAVAGHHMLTLWQLFRNPVFPLLNDIFQSPYFEAKSLSDLRFRPREFLQIVAYPFYWTETNNYVVSELPFRDWRGAIAYVAIVIGSCALFVRSVSGVRRDAVAETKGLGLIYLFVVTSFFVWELSFGIYRYAVPLEMLTGIVTMGTLIRLLPEGRPRIAIAILALIGALSTTIYLDWGRGEHPSAGIRPARYEAKYINIQVPPLPANSIVLIATGDPVSYFIPFAEPSAQFLGIDNNFLELSQNNKFVEEINRLMRSPRRPKFILSVGDLDADKLNKTLQYFGLRLTGVPCQAIRSNLEEEALSLCEVGF